MKTFNRLSQEKGYHIYLMYKKLPQVIAKDIGKNKSTIERELYS
jgi:IS30 family transposase